MADDKKRIMWFTAPGVIYHARAGILYVVAEAIVDREGMPRTAESCIEVTEREARRFYHENGGCRVNAVVVIPLPGVLPGWSDDDPDAWPATADDGEGKTNGAA